MDSIDLKGQESKIFLTSDTHFGHSNSIIYGKRPFTDKEDMNAKLIENWNKVVPEDGIVFHLGDFALCGTTKIKEILSQLNGQIHLIRGNHDDLRSTVRDLFASIEYQRVFKYQGKLIYLNHFPFVDLPEASIQFHGHIHSGPANLIKLQNNQYDVGVDNNDYVPISLENALNIVYKNMNYVDS